jgi:hypothetical protein
VDGGNDGGNGWRRVMAVMALPECMVVASYRRSGLGGLRVVLTHLPFFSALSWLAAFCSLGMSVIGGLFGFSIPLGSDLPVADPFG